VEEVEVRGFFENISVFEVVAFVPRLSFAFSSGSNVAVQFRQNAAFSGVFVNALFNPHFVHAIGKPILRSKCVQ
jgi:hypothetical protein